MLRLATLTALTLATLLPSARAQQCGSSLVEGFEGLSNIGAWGWANSVVQANVFTGGNPSAWLKSSKMLTPLPILYAQDPLSPFAGDWRAAGVSSIGIDLFAVDLDLNQCGRPLTLELRSDAGTPGMGLDDMGAVFVGPAPIPCKDANWHSYTVAVPSQSSSLPPGWTHWSNAGLSGDQVWNALMQDVTTPAWLLGNPSTQYFASSWQLGADNPRLGYLGGASSYCTAQHNSAGCSPSLTWSGAPSTSGGSFDVQAQQVLVDTPGLWFYGFGPTSQAVLGGVLCVAPPLKRLPVQFSGGGPQSCTGALALDVNLLIQSGLDPQLVVGATLHLQAWSRDPAAAQGSSLSNALAFTICP